MWDTRYKAKRLDALTTKTHLEQSFQCVINIFSAKKSFKNAVEQAESEIDVKNTYSDGHKVSVQQLKE